MNTNNLSRDNKNVNFINSKKYTLRDNEAKIAALEIEATAAEAGAPRPMIHLPFTLVFLF